MSSLLIIFVISSCVTFGDFPSKFSKCCFQRCIHSYWLAAFNLVLAILFLLLVLFTISHATKDCLSSTESLILLIWFCMYSVCSFRYMLVNSFCAFLSFCVLILVGLLLIHREVIFTSAHIFKTANVSHRTLGLALCLVGIYSAAASKWALTKFSYLSFAVGVYDIFWSALNLFLSVNVYSSLTSLLLSREQ